MESLDLTVVPPRSPREALDGLVFLPRSIDKVRATLPGGNPGAYTVAGLTQTMLDTLGIPLDAFVEAISAAPDDRAVATFIREHAAPEKYAAWNAIIAKREPRGGNRAEAITVYPWLADRPDVILVLDVLEEDDKHAFAGAH